MPRSIPATAHPIQTLRDNTDDLEASILLCLARPDKRAIHKLRTSTRRIEAQLQLLAMLPHLPPHKKEARKAARLLKKLRRAAGRVRDLDVQRDLIAHEAAGRHRGPRPTAELRSEAGDLRQDLKYKRDEEAARLQRRLKKHHVKLPLVFEKLLSALQPAQSLSLPEAKLTTLVREWYASHTSASAPHGEAQLHDIRKHAKLARYIAESAPESATSAHLLAARFESLQQAGGKWHDWLLLHELSTRQLGKSAKLPPRFCAHANTSLRAFKRRLTKAA